MAAPEAYFTTAREASRWELWRMDLATNEAFPIGLLGLANTAVSALALTPDGTLYGFDVAEGGRLVTIDPATGTATVVGGHGMPEPDVVLHHLASDACGRLWAEGRVGVAGVYFRRVMLAIDPVTGGATEIVELGPDVLVGGLAARGETIYALRDRVLTTFDPQTGSFTPIGYTGRPYFNGFDFDADGTLWAVTNPITIIPEPPPAWVFQIDTETGQLHWVVPNSWLVSGFAGAPAGGECVSGPPVAIPAASPLGLAVLAILLAIGGAVRSRRTRPRPAAG